MLGRTETRTRDRMCLGMIRSVRDISRDDRARIATCSLRTPTDRLMENYSIDNDIFILFGAKSYIQCTHIADREAAIEDFVEQMLIERALLQPFL